MAYLGQSLTEGTRRVYNYVATASQTTFNAIYGVGAVDVYQNGVLLAEADYVATTGTTVVLGTGAALNDEITIVCHNTFSVADTVSASSGGTFNGDVTFDQNVGIGTGSPSNILHVSGTSGTPVLLERTNGSACTIAFKGNATTNNPYLGANGNDLYFNTGTSEAMRIDSSGNLLVGTTSSSSNTAGIKLTSAGTATFVRSGVQPVYVNRLTNDGDLAVFAKDGATVGSIGTVSGDLSIGSDDAYLFFDGGANKMVPASTSTGGASDGLIELGASDRRFKDLYLSGTANVGGMELGGIETTGSYPLSVKSNSSHHAIHIEETSGNEGYTIGVNAAGDLGFYNSGGATATATLDDSGNLLVGTTTANGEGISIRGGIANYIYSSRSQAPSMYLDRLTSDGDILEFRKNGSTVGSIGAVSGDLGIGTGDCGIKFVDQNETIYPANPNSSFANNDATVSLGVSTNRFKDLYLSGGAYLGGTTSSNKLDEYEEGTWTPAYAGSSTDGIYTYSEQQGHYIRIGNQVTCWWNMTNVATTTEGTGTVSIENLPYAANWASGFNGEAIGSCQLNGFTNIDGDFITVKVNDGETRILVYKQTGSNNSTESVSIGHKVSGGSDVRGFVTYYVGG